VKHSDVAYVCVFCSGKPDVEPVYLDLAGEAGRVIGARGHGLVYGGGGHGMMGSLAVAAGSWSPRPAGARRSAGNRYG
jgi:predicted Rossmann-fold nucleotide-binding protein